MKTLLVHLLAGGLTAWSTPPDWSRNASIPDGGRPNPYDTPAGEWRTDIRKGKLHALHYPVSVTGILLPYGPLKSLLETMKLARLDTLQSWLGLYPYPENEGMGPFEVPFPDGRRPPQRMGFTLTETARGVGFTISCAQCHTESLFGRPVIGLATRFPRANAFFYRGLQIEPWVDEDVFALVTGATAGERGMFRDSKFAAHFVRAKMPVQLGLDTSLAQVAMSLATRDLTPWAHRIEGLPDRDEPLTQHAADSKPAVWWNVKYKNRWLSDGSVVSGNPIFTNLLWNEIGRGTDLESLSEWLRTNPAVVRELTSAVFASEAPRWTDYFPATSLNESVAKSGERIFLSRCARCHGIYEKGWNLPHADRLTPVERLLTVRVRYHASTPVMDVGTDPSRHEGMGSLAQLNNLAISRQSGVEIVPQHGYVPPPLVGIWARWPYFHNNSAPTLCAVLTRASGRPTRYWARPAVDAERDFDRACNGYPSNPPTDLPKWLSRQELHFDTRMSGRHASGHDEGIFLKGGRELLAIDDKKALITFLQTL